jgi:hypothetical protein
MEYTKKNKKKTTSGLAVIRSPSVGVIMWVFGKSIRFSITALVSSRRRRGYPFIIA